MRSPLNLAAVAAAGATLLLAAAPAQAQRVPTIALKSGESADLGPIYWVAQCRSILKTKPEVEILDGPPGLTAEIKEAMVLPRRQGCPNKVSGGILTVSANDIEDHSMTRLTLRILYRTKDGDRQRSQVYRVSLHPK
jgi:hypothetical protein